MPAADRRGAAGVADGSAGDSLHALIREGAREVRHTRSAAPAPASHPQAEGAVPGGRLCVEVLVAGAARLGDRPLTYRVPEHLRAFAAVGVRAVVPLGARRAVGYVVAVRPDTQSGAGGEAGTADPGDAPPLSLRLGLHGGAPRGRRAEAPVRQPHPIPAGRPGPRTAVRDVIDLPDDVPMFSERLLALAREVAADTLSSLRDAVDCLVPPDVFRRPPPPRPPLVARTPGRPQPRRLGPRQAAVLAAVSAAPAGVPLPAAVRAGGRAALRRLAAAGLVTLREAPRTPLRAVEEPGATPRSDRQPGATLVVGPPDARAAWIADAAAAAVRAGRRALVVVPEIADVAGMAARLRGAGTVGVLHSGLPAAERRTVWAQARDGAVDVLTGTRSALFAAVPRLGLIAVDDEQSESYKADAAPRYHARDVAIRRARLEGARLVLASAAPSVETYAAAAGGAMAVVRLPARRPAPAVAVVDMRAERQRGHVGYLSRALVQAITRHLRGGGRVALIVQQTGYARVLLCRECGAAVRCRSCDVAMAYDREEGTVACRVCGRSGPAPDLCPRCRGVQLRGVGAGTKRLEEVVRHLFPALRIARLDAETARAADRIAGDFTGRRVRLLIGTSLLLRALRVLRAPDAARPTLVGVIDADGPMYVPDFRAAERTLQRLCAAVDLAGPAVQGAAGPAPEVVLQTRVPDHPVLRAVASARPAVFYDAELRARRDFGYPPYARLVRLVAEAETAQAAGALAASVAAAARAHGLDVLGPAPLRGRGGTHVQCVLRGRTAGPADAAAVRDAARAAVAEVAVPAAARLVVDVDPQAMV
jgi:primosomal protein N' (replication factor Y)